MTVQAVEAHIDSCTGVPPTRKKPLPILSTQNPITNVSSTTVSKPIPKPKALPHPHYASIKDVQLRKKLLDQGLSAGGSRPQLEKRWSEFVIANNANCDAKNPKTKSELKRQMEVWERTQGGIDREGALIKDKNFDGSAWGAKHENVFSDLTALARSKIPKKTSEQPRPSLETRLDSHPSHRPRIESTVEDEGQTSSPAPAISHYSSPYQDVTAHITKGDYTDSASLPPQIGQTDRSIPTYPTPQPPISQPADDYSIPPSSQLQQTSSGYTEHNNLYG